MIHRVAGRVAGWVFAFLYCVGFRVGFRAGRVVTLRRFCVVVVSVLIVLNLLMVSFAVSPYEVRSTTETDSMVPAIPPGAVVLCVDSIDSVDDVSAGDIVSADHGEQTVMHRVVNVDRGSGAVLTEGDNSDRADGWTSVENVNCKRVTHVDV